ncbi:MAG: hypothetical protein FJY85_09390 [Deltaproteobacteria bacterium]|nr:hypothetical protein [Deltaproteobacteria bacterium]
MNDIALLERLEEIAHRLGVELRYENLTQGVVRSEGGFCRVAGRPLILINRKDSRDQKIRVLCRALNKLDLQGIFIPPAVRTVIESHNN